jgi:hypothetical protein
VLLEMPSSNNLKFIGESITDVLWQPLFLARMRSAGGLVRSSG